MRQKRIHNVVVMHSHGPMRMLLGMALADAGYTVTAAPTYSAVLHSLRKVAEPAVVVAGNWEPNYRAEVEFFRYIAAEAALGRRWGGSIVLCC